MGRSLIQKAKDSKHESNPNGNQITVIITNIVYAVCYNSIAKSTVRTFS